MERRELLTCAGAGMSGVLAGCLGTETSESTEIIDVEFETGVDVDKSFDDDPSVNFEDDEIHVTGRYSTGNACYDEHLQDPSYDADDDVLQIDVTRQHDGSDECESLEELVSYRVTVYVDGPLPETVEVTEDMGGETTAESRPDPFGE